MTSVLDHLMQHYGYYAVTALILLECIGVPLPGETALITASVYAGTTHQLNAVAVAGLAAAAAVAGDNIGFALGRRHGPRLVAALARRFRRTSSYVAVVDSLFARHGAQVVLVGRFVGLLRTWAALLAGAHGMRWRAFATANLVGGVLWAGAWTAAGFYLGTGAARLGHWATLAGMAATLLVSVALAHVAKKRLPTVGEPVSENAQAATAPASTVSELADA